MSNVINIKPISKRQVTTPDTCGSGFETGKEMNNKKAFSDCKIAIYYILIENEMALTGKTTIHLYKSR